MSSHVVLSDHVIPCGAHVSSIVYVKEENSDINNGEEEELCPSTVHFCGLTPCIILAVGDSFNILDRSYFIKSGIKVNEAGVISVNLT